MKFHSNLFLAILLISCHQFLHTSEESKQESRQGTIDLEKHIPRVTPNQISRHLVDLSQEIASLIPAEKNNEILEKITQIMIEEMRSQPTRTKYNKKIISRINKVIEETLQELEEEKELNTCLAKLKHTLIVLKKNLTVKTAIKAIIYRIAASLDSIFMTYVFVTHDISLEQALQLGAVDIVGKFILYYAYDRIWQAQCCNSLWAKIKCCKKDESSDDESETEQEQAIPKTLQGKII